MSTTARQELTQAYLNRANTEPLVGFMVGSYYPLHRYAGARGLPQGLYSPQDLRVEAYLPDYERLYQLHAACPGDLVWSASAFWGVPWLEACLGCPVEADHVTGSSRSHPVEAEWPTVPAFSPHNPWVARCVEMVSAIDHQAAGRYPVGTTLMRGVSDLLSALLGLDRMIYAMLDQPTRIHALAEAITDFWIAFGHAQLDACTPYQGGYGSFFYNLWAPGRCVWLQEDAAALLSPELFERFILPCDKRIAQAFDYTFIHNHPARYIPYQPLLDSELAVIELHIDKGGPSARDLLPVYREILAEKPLYVWGDISEHDLQVLLKLGPEGVALEPVVASPEEAERLYQRYVR